MPELPEVERAANLMRTLTLGKTISAVDTAPDTIVFSGCSNDEFAKEVSGRTVKAVGRYGKAFYLELDGSGRMPVLHFGMTGMLQVKGKLPVHYREAPRKVSADWPPRFMKFVLHIDSSPSVEIAFLDARRLGRIRLCKTPLTEPPISNMGFDPVISMPDLDDFMKGARKRSCPIKALLLDQSFSAGVGNWVADEILYHARVHPEQRCNALSDDQLTALHHQTSEICRIAVEVNADDSKFPDDWLFKHRWGKGKGSKKKKSDSEDGLKLPSGEPATIKWITVGGRTSAYIAELQKLLHGKARASKIQDGDGDGELTSLDTYDIEMVVKTQSPKRKRNSASESKSSKRKRSSGNGEDEEASVGLRRSTREKR